MLSPTSWKDGGLDVYENDRPLTVGSDVIVPFSNIHKFETLALVLFTLSFNLIMLMYYLLIQETMLIQ